MLVIDKPKSRELSNSVAIMLTPDYDIIIIGQGLAGSILACTLIEHGQRVLVVDNDHVGSASKVAAGIINPVTGHRLNISDRFTEYYPVATLFYKNLEETLSPFTDQPFLQTIKQTRLIKNQAQKSYLSKRQEQSAYDDLLANNPDDVFSEACYGAIEVQKTAVVDTKALLEAVKRYLVDRDAYQCKKIDHQEIVQTNNQCTLGNISARHMIFCEGYQALENPWLKHLPFKLAKGEILTIQTKPCLHDSLLSWGNWLVTSNGQAKLGSNFIWNDLTLTPKTESREKLLSSLHDNTKIHGTVIDHEVGIRPTTTQRIPFIGPIKDLANAYCFNGFGSKGCLLIPFYADLLTQHLLNNHDLPKELSQWI